MLFSVYLLTLTNKRVFAEDELGTLIFNYYIKDIDRGEIDKTFWKGPASNSCSVTATIISSGS